LRTEDSRSSSQKPYFDSPKSRGILDDLRKNDNTLWCQDEEVSCKSVSEIFLLFQLENKDKYVDGL